MIILAPTQLKEPYSQFDIEMGSGMAVKRLASDVGWS